MRKALACLLAAQCFAGRAFGATLDSIKLAEPVRPVALADLSARLPGLPAVMAEPAKLSALMERAAQLELPAQDSVPGAARTRAEPQATPQFIANLQQTLSPFSAEEIRNMPASDLEAVARRIMDGAAPSAATSAEVAPAISLPEPGLLPAASLQAPAKSDPPAPRRLYLLSQPLEVSAELGPVARAVHYAFELGFHAAKSLLLLKAGMPLGAVAAEFAFSMAKAPAMISLQSMGDLQARYWFKKLKTLKAVAQIPGVTRIAVLTGTETHFKKIIAARQDNRGLIFIESAAPLNETTAPGLGRAPSLGKPMLIADPKEAKIALSLEIEGAAHPSSWTPSLQDLLDRKPIPDEVAAAWRERIREAKKDKPWLHRFFDFELERSLRIRAELIEPSGRRIPMGALAQGSSAKRLLGVTRLDQALRAIKIALGPAPKQVKHALPKPPDFYRRSIPLSDTAVERGPVQTRRRDLPGRLWRLLTGRLIRIKQ